MTTHTSVLSWEFSWAEEPGRLQSVGHTDPQCVTQNVRYNLATKQQPFL